MQKIWKKVTALFVFCAIISGIVAMIPFSVYADGNENSIRQEKQVTVENAFREVTVYINDEVMTTRGKLIEETTYVPLRSVCEEFESCEVSWNDGIATVVSDSMRLDAQQGSHYVNANGRVLYHSKPIKNIDSRIYVPIRVLAKAYSLELKWDESEKSVKLYGDPKGLRSAEAYYSSEDLYWLSRIIHAESAGEPLTGKIAVGNVVINRKNRADYPNTIKGVIFDKKYGTQFTPVASGTIYQTPSSESVLAAKICLDGFSLNHEMIFFINPRIATNFWIVNTRTHVLTIGNHKFYK